MKDSLSLHGGLTPGREGKGREQGRGREGRWATSSFSVTHVTREEVIGR